MQQTSWGKIDDNGMVLNASMDKSHHHDGGQKINFNRVSKIACKNVKDTPVLMYFGNKFFIKYASKIL